jgi:hypothetical protein
MSNRFTPYVRTDYQALPIDYYQAALASKEQEHMQELNNDRQMLDYAGGIEAIYNPDKQLKEQYLSDVDSKIAELAANKNLRTPEVLMKLNNIVNDRKMINDLVGIQRNTANYQKYLESKKAYQEKYGNDINFDPHEQRIAQYNQQGRDGFQSNFLSDSSINSYVDINEGIQKVLEKMKPQKLEKMSSDGQWLYKYGNETLTMNELLNVAAQQLKDPKYSTQLGLINNYNLRRYGGGDTQQGMLNYRDMNVQAMGEKVQQLQQQLGQYKPGTTEYKQLQQAIATIKSNSDDIKDLSGRELASYVNGAMPRDLALMAASPFVIDNHTEDIKDNPYALMRLKYSLADQNMARKQARDLANKKEMVGFNMKVQDEINTVNPTIFSAPMTLDGKSTYTPVVNFDKMGGFDMGDLSETVSALLRNTPTIMSADGSQADANKITVYSPDDKKNISLSEAVKRGFAQIGYVPGTKDYYIQSPSGNFRVKADLGMQQAMDKVYRMFDQETPLSAEAPARIPLSFDGKTQVPALVYKELGPNGFQPKIFAEMHQGFDAGKLKPKEFATLTGVDFNDNLAKNQPNGFYVALKYTATENNGGTMALKRFMSYADYQRMLASGELTDKNVEHSSMWSVQNGKIIPVQEYEAGDAGQNIISNQIKFETQRGGQLENVKQKMRTQNMSVGVKAALQNSASNTDYDYDDED